MSYAMGLIVALLAGMFVFGLITAGVFMVILGLCGAWMLVVGAIMGDGEKPS